MTQSSEDDAARGDDGAAGASRAEHGRDTREDALPQRPKRRRRIVGGLVGLALFAGAIASIVYAGAGTHAALRKLLEVPTPILLLVLILPVANLMLTSMCFQALTRRYAFVEPREMHALIAGSFLLNFLPFRPGLFGRVAYHVKVNGMRVRDAARVLVEAIACTAVAMVLLLVTLLLVRIAPALAMVFMGTVTLGIVLAWMHARRTQNTAIRAYAIATLIKLADILLWGGRYVVVFALLGKPVSAREGVSLAVVANAASLVPLAGNGLGLREWAVGIMAATLPGGRAGWGGTGMMIETGLSADLINRAAEIIVAIVLGVPALIWLSRRMARARAGVT